MSEPTLYWCVCRRYCKGVRRPLNTLQTWRRHLREASEDEKEVIRLGRRSEQFRTFIQGTSAATSGSTRSGGQPDLSLPTGSRRPVANDADEPDRRPSRRPSSPLASEVFLLPNKYYNHINILLGWTNYWTWRQPRPATGRSGPPR